jgi:biofilm PGA synthesis protein PgaD
MNPLIINRPDLQSFRQKYGQSLLTLLIWVMFFFFMRPLIGLVGWFFGLQLFTDVMIVHGGYQALIELLGIYFGIIVCMGLILEGWALYNLLRYGRNEKRIRQPVPVSIAEQARHFEVAAEQLAHWQTLSFLVLEHDDQGNLTGGSTE